MQNYNIINSTPHELVLYSQSGEKLRTWSKSPAPARVAEDIQPAHRIPSDGTIVPMFRVNVDENATELPDPIEGTYFVVSRVTAMHYPERSDFIFPFNEVRDETGRVIGCRGFASFATDTPDTDIAVPTATAVEVASNGTTSATATVSTKESTPIIPESSTENKAN